MFVDSTRKRLIPGAIPTLNLPKKKFDAEPQPRWEIQRQEMPTKKTRVYKHLDEFKRAIARTKLSSWSRKETEHHCTLEYFDSQHATPLYSTVQK